MSSLAKLLGQSGGSGKRAARRTGLGPASSGPVLLVQGEGYIAEPRAGNLNPLPAIGRLGSCCDVARAVCSLASSRYHWALGFRHASTATAWVPAGRTSHVFAESSNGECVLGHGGPDYMSSLVGATPELRPKLTLVRVSSRQ
jgi:hypothetical protein